MVQADDPKLDPKEFVSNEVSGDNMKERDEADEDDGASLQQQALACEENASFFSILRSCRMSVKSSGVVGCGDELKQTFNNTSALVQAEQDEDDGASLQQQAIACEEKASFF